jgi:hypothetical protein
MYMVIRNEVKVMLFRLSVPRIFDQDCLNMHYLTILFHKNTLALILESLGNLNNVLRINNVRLNK